MTQIKQLKDGTTNNGFYPITHAKAVIGLEELLDGKTIEVTESELCTLILSSLLEPGVKYRIIGFTSAPNPYLGLKSAGHKIDLIIKASASNVIERKAYALYNTDGTDSFYEDRDIPIQDWDIEVAINGSELGLAIGMSTTLKEPTSLYVGQLVAVASNEIDTLIAVYNNTDKIAISKDGGQTFYTQTLPQAFTDIYGVLYGNNTFVIFDEHGTMAVSTDNADTWQVIKPFDYTELFEATGENTRYMSGFCSSCYGNDQFYIVGNRVGIKSRDGLNWESFDWKSYDLGWFRPVVAAGDGIIGITAYTYQIYWSFDDGRTWANRIPASNYWEAICFGDHKFSLIAGNRQCAVVRDTDTITSITWPEGTYQSGGAFPRDSGKMSFNNGIFYCFASFREDSSYAYSLDGLNWTAVQFPKVAYPCASRQIKLAFGPKGELYVADSISNSIWMNPSPTESSTWQILSPTGIDKFLSTFSINDLSIVIPKENSSYYLSYGGLTYTPYKFPMGMSSTGVTHNGELFETVLYNHITHKAFYSTSRNGITWSLIEFPYDTPTPCSSLVSIGPDLLCTFEGGQMYWISAGNITAITYTGETYEKSYTVYNSVTSSCLYAAKESNVSNIYLLSLEESSASAASITLPQSLVIQHMTSAGPYAYVSGYKSSNTDTTYTIAIDLRNNQTISLSVPGYLTSSVADGTRLIASTSTNALVVIECEQVLTIEGVEVSGVYSSDGNILCLIVGSDHLNVLGYSILHTLQINRLTDEFGNSCTFDFKNIVKDTNEGDKYFFNSGQSDYSLTGKVYRCKQYGDSAILSNAYLELSGKLLDVDIIGEIKGTLIFPHGGKYIKISDVKNTCNFEKMQNTLTNINAKWLNSEGDTTVISDLNMDTRYLTSDEGTTWQVDTTDRIVEDDITMLVLGTTSLKEAYLKPFDEETAEQLINIIGQ